MSKAGCFSRCCAAVLIIGVGHNAEVAFARDSVTHAPPSVFACFSLQCGVPPHGAFPNLVIGRVAAIADAGQAEILFNGMRRRGRWSGLPSGSKLFWKNLQPVAIDVGHGAVMVTLTSQSEMHAAPLDVGDFVRYSPHRGKYEVPPTDETAAAYWRVDGCVAVLCRAGDKPCMKQYVSGLFRTSDGEQISPRTLTPLERGTFVDVQTMLPRKAVQMK